MGRRPQRRGGAPPRRSPDGRRRRRGEWGGIGVGGWGLGVGRSGRTPNPHLARTLHGTRVIVSPGPRRDTGLVGGARASASPGFYPPGRPAMGGAVQRRAEGGVRSSPL